METTYAVVLERLTALFFALTIAYWISWFAWRKGFYTVPIEPPSIGPRLQFKHVLEAFILFLFLELLLVPSIYENFVLGKAPQDLTNHERGWLNILSALATASVLLFLVWTLKPQIRQQIFGMRGLGSSLKQKAKAYFCGCLSWGIIYPWVLALGQLIAIIVSWFHHGPGIDQVAVKHLRDIVSDPVLFGVTVFAVVTFIPFLEELLFRGFLQSWLKISFGRGVAIGVTSLVFALFHFSTKQGFENIELLLSLFLLACFLGFIKEKFQSLWASVGLHSTFNLISVLMLFS